MWKASFTSVLSIKKKPAGVTVGVTASSSYEGNFRETTSGPFKTAWEAMKNNNNSFVESRMEGITRMLSDDHFSTFDSLAMMSGTNEYQNCQISHILTK